MVRMTNKLTIKLRAVPKSGSKNIKIIGIRKNRNEHKIIFLLVI